MTVSMLESDSPSQAPLRRSRRPLRLGFCPIGKFVFSHEDALRQKSRIAPRLDRPDVEIVSIDDVLPDGLVRDQSHVEPVVRHFRDQRIDALFIPHCNFGTEGAAGMIAKACGVPTSLWAPRDAAPEPDGSRLRDSLCGTLATSKVLNTLRVPFSYIPNTTIEDPAWDQAIDRFIRAARLVRAMRTMRIGQLGQRIDFFWSTIVDEAELLDRFGVQVLPLDLTGALREICHLSTQRAGAYEQELRQLERWITFEGYNDRRVIYHQFAARDWLLATAQKHQLDAFAVQSFASIQRELGTALSLGFAMVDDAGIPVSPETDIHGAITSVLLEAASTTPEPSFLPDITIRHPDDDNAVLLWHADAPLSLRHPDSPVKVGVPWILRGLPSGLLHMRLKDGPLTLCRFDGGAGDYRLGAGQGHTLEGPFTQEFYTWLRVEDWPRWEQQLIHGPYIHHCSCVYSHCIDALQEAARYLPGLRFEHFGVAPFTPAV